MSGAKPFEFDANKYRQASIHLKEWGTRLIAELKQAFRDETVANMIKLTQQADGTQFESFRRINVLTKK